MDGANWGMGAKWINMVTILKTLKQSEIKMKASYLKNNMYHISTILVAQNLQ